MSEVTRLQAGQLRNHSSFAGKTKRFCPCWQDKEILLFPVVPILALGSTQCPIQLILGARWLWCKADDLHLMSGLTVYGAVPQPFHILHGMHKDSFTFNITFVSVRTEKSSLEMFCLYRVDPIHVMYSNLHSFVPLEIFLQAESF